jgi:acylphosphatase
MKHLSILVQGKVQGVFFRASTKERAEELGLTGTVRNLPDGNVHIEVEGSEEALQEFVIWCHEGPRHARVDTVEVQESDPRNLTSFQITR